MKKKKNGPLTLRRLALMSLALLAAACGTPPASSPAAGTLLPNENLFVQGIPAIPMALVRKVEDYTDFRGHGFVDWHPRRDEMLVAHRKAGANTAQLFRVARPLGELEQLTDFADPVSEASYEPELGRYLVFARSSGGNEADQLYRLDLEGAKRTTLLTDPDERHAMIDWLHGRAELLVSSVPLDRTAAEGSRANPATTLWLIDPLRPEAKRKLAELPGPGWFGGAVSWDDRRVAMTRYRSATESEVWLVDLANGATTQLLPAQGEALEAAHFPIGFRRDGSGLFVLSDRAGEFRELMLYDFAGGGLTRVTGHIPWDVSDVALSEDGSLVALRMNIDGRTELRLLDAANLRERPLPALPPGSVNSVGFHPATNRLAFALDSAQGPNQLYAMDASGGVQAWTKPFVPAGLQPSTFQPQRTVRWKSFDGRELSAVLSPPPARFGGKRPVVVLVHGGPEGQATYGFLGRWNYLINELGVAVVEPNVRGSAGYGKTFLTLDNGYKREDAVKDLGSLLDWIATQPELDASRVLVAGGSYGGYMSLAASVHYADRIAGAIDIVGISNFVTFLNNTESYRRDLRRAEYGDERDPQMREFLERISPLNNVQKIEKPLFVVQGRNDPRVPWTEAEQIVEKVRANGVEVWYLRAENEGHGFARKENADYQFYATVLFLQRTLLK